MKDFKMACKDTICAIATPPGSGGIGIVRISGARSLSVLAKIWEGRKDVSSLESHKMYLGRVFNPKTGNLIDMAMAVWMRGPQSYTGEDVVEISSHGSQAVLGQILDASIAAGAKIAEPGEFTKRAFLNGKMDLVQAEAVADLIAATNEAAARAALMHLEGRLSHKITGLTDELTGILAFVEASIDFPEEDIEYMEKEKIASRLQQIIEGAKLLADTYTEGRIIKDGVNVTIVGKPNVGKSSLFNAIIGNDRAIVHHAPGTTRDLVKETAQLGGMAFHLTDAAGLWTGEHEVEKIGIEKAKKAIYESDVVIFVLDGSENLDDFDYEIYKLLDPLKTITCVNKSDLPPAFRKLPFGSAENKFALVSAVTGEGIDSLKNILVSEVVGTKLSGKTIKTGKESIVVTSARHKEALDCAIANLNEAVKAAEERQSAEFIAHHISLAHEALGRITGRVTTESVLNEIFSRFCIGK
jgi:tRNA modification GTPase